MKQEPEKIFDRRFMIEAIKLAKKGEGHVNPNPMVGAVIVRDGVIISEGYHEKYGQWHAERKAIKNAGESLKGTTIYITLEPCTHRGKTPPCADLIIESGIKRAVIGTADPNPLVAGKGIEKLRAAGIEVTVGVLEEECRNLNRVFMHYIKEKKPYVVLKYAMALDGKICTRTGDSKWISSEESRRKVHSDRHRYSAIMVGVGTVLKDDPMLNVRGIENSNDPVRIICDSHLKTPLDSNVVKTAKYQETIIVTTCEDVEKYCGYVEKGCRIMVQKGREKVNLNELVEELGKRGIDSILLEGGGSLNWSAVESGIINEINAYVSPKIIGGDRALTPVSGRGFENMKDVLNIKDMRFSQIGPDILIEGYVENFS